MPHAGPTLVAHLPAVLPLGTGSAFVAETTQVSPPGSRLTRHTNIWNCRARSWHQVRLSLRYEGQTGQHQARGDEPIP